ncbi:MAG TPA: hypothetical protein VKQ30_11540 [Ktedonobacterales bacterium]|nr:hypothetical protein [Ktedonobacterales bacterium]
MDLVAVTDIDAAFAQLRERLTRGAEVFDVRLLTPEGAGPARALWHEREGIWAILEPDDAQSMYWCSFGTTKPTSGGNVYYVCMGNLSRKREAWNTAGALAADPKTHDLYYVHSGQFGKKTQQFAEHYRGIKANVTWPTNKVTPRYVIGRLRDKEFIGALAAFVKTAEGVKTGKPASLESYYRNAIIDGVEAAIDQARLQQPSGDLGPVDIPTGASVSRTRLARLEDLQRWLRDDPEMLQTAVDLIVGKTEQDRRRHLLLSVCAAGASILIGWLLSAVRPDTFFPYILHAFR